MEHKQVVCFRIEKEIKDQLDATAKQYRFARSRLVRNIVADWFVNPPSEK